MEVEVFVDSWVSLPGDAQNWPQKVISDQIPTAGLANNGHPAVQLKPGTHQLSGEFRWSAIPQKIALPPSIGIVALVREGIQPHDLGAILDQQGSAVRTGHHCAQPAMDRLGVPATARISFGLYNTREDVEAAVRAIAEVKEAF